MSQEQKSGYTYTLVNASMRPPYTSQHWKIDAEVGEGYEGGRQQAGVRLAATDAYIIDTTIIILIGIIILIIIIVPE